MSQAMQVKSEIEVVGETKRGRRQRGRRGFLDASVPDRLFPFLNVPVARLASIVPPWHLQLGLPSLPRERTT